MKTYRVTITLELVREIQASEECFAIQEGQDKLIEHIGSMEIISSAAVEISDDEEN